MFPAGGGGGGLLPSNRLVGICRWMGSLFHGWIGYYGVAFIRLTRMEPHIFGIWGIRNFRLVGILKWEDFCFIIFNQCVNSFQYELVKRLYKVDAYTESY